MVNARSVRKHVQDQKYRKISHQKWYSTPPILRAPIIRGPPQLRGLLAADFSSQKFLVKRGKPEFSSLRSIVLILNRPPVVQ